jgi:hypothetical protein
MKKVIFGCIAVLIFAACDKVKNPNQNPNAVTNCVLSAPVVKTNSLTSGFRKILLEDYTGHTCGNCPRAAEDAETIIGNLKDSVVVMAIHAGTQFAPPSPPDYVDDFRTDPGTAWDSNFGISAAGLPKGMVNRAITPYPQSRANWPSLAAQNLHMAQKAQLDITTYFDVAHLLLNVDVKTTFKTAVTGGNVNLCLIITEDSIIGHQKDYSPPTGSNVINGDERPDYVFNHMVRGSLNGAWGDVIKAAPVAVNDTITKKYICNTITCTRTDKVNLVVFVYNDATKEILQVEKIKLK